MSSTLFLVLTSSTKVWFAPETCWEIPGSSEVIPHGNRKNREVQKSVLTGTERTGKFRSHCSQEGEEQGSLEAISCHFARIYLSSAYSNFFWELASCYALSSLALTMLR